MYSYFDPTSSILVIYMYEVLQDLTFWDSWRSISLGAELWQEYFNPNEPNQLSPMFYILGHRQMTKRVVSFSSTTLFAISSSSDIDTLLRRNIFDTLMLFTLWINMLDVKDQNMKVMGSDLDGRVWQQYKLISTRYISNCIFQILQNGNLCKIDTWNNE